ncbi:cytochrome c oxidase assembly protein, partial [Enterobacter roggenkampii]
MAVAIGASIGLSRSAPPVPQEVPAVGDVRTLSLVGFLPPSDTFTVASLFVDVEMDWAAFALALAMAGFYATGVVRLRRRGDAWSVRRTV